MRPILPLCLLAGLLFAAGCERHSAAVTVKGYAEKQEAKEKESYSADKKDVDREPPQFFPSPTPAGH